MATDWSNVTAAECFAQPLDEQQVACSAQHLNITNPPSIYDWTSYSFLWQPITCLLSNVTYSNRINQEDDFNFCTVPQEGNDTFLFAALAMLAAACFSGKLAVVWVLLAGGVLGTLNYFVNLLELSNGIALWLGISPPDLFFYAFIPPLAVDSSMRLDIFLFKKTWVHMLLTAFVMVIFSAFLLTPIVLFALGFQDRGFNWAHVALFAAMIASTDALSVTAILKKTGGPQRLIVMLEGESLLNDASAITLFEVFKRILEDNANPALPFPSVWSSIPTIILDTLKLAGIGAGVGLALSMGLGYLLRWLRWRGARPSAESIAVLATSYLSFYVANSPAGGSGVIAVVVFGLWGNHTRKWGMLASGEESGAFDAFWDAVSLGANGLVFFWSGCASINFFIRSIDILSGSAWSYAAIPIIWVVSVLIRTGCIALFNISAFRWLRETLSWPEVLFAGWAGLRGSVSLIMTADYLTHSTLILGDNPDGPASTTDYVNSEITIWTSAFVLLTLVINAPTLAPLVRLLRLDSAARARRAQRARAKRALCRFTRAAIGSLRDQEQELLQGANWEAVAHYCDLSRDLPSFDPPATQPAATKQHGQQGSDGGFDPNSSGGSDAFSSRAAGAAGGSPTRRGSLGRGSFASGSHAGGGGGTAEDDGYSSTGDYDHGGSDAGSICAELAQELPFLQAQQAQHAQQPAGTPAGTPPAPAGPAADAAAGAGTGAAQDASPAVPAAVPAVPVEPAEPAEHDVEQGVPSTRAPSLEYFDAYYSSMPSTTGNRMQQQLRLALAAGRRQQQGQQQGQQQQQQREAPAGSPGAAAAAAAAAAPLDLESAASYQSISASAGTKMRQQLAQQLALLRQQQQQQQAGGTALGDLPEGRAADVASTASSTGPPSPRARPPRPAMQHGYTLSGASGATMAAELQRQLSQARRLGPAAAGATLPLPPMPTEPLQRDLLGRKLKKAGSASSLAGGWPLQPAPAAAAAAAAVAAVAAGAGGAYPSLAPTSGGAPTEGAGGAQLSGLPAGSALPTIAAATPLSACLHMRRMHTFHAGPAENQQQGQGQQQQSGSPSASAATHPVVNVVAFGRTASGPGSSPCSEGGQPAGSRSGSEADDELESEALHEMREKLMAGIKRACHVRRTQGLLSAEGLRILQFAVDQASEHADQPLHVWRFLEKEVEGGLGPRVAARTLLLAARAYSGLPRLAKRLASGPFKLLSGWLRRMLGRRMLAACEVAVEYWLALERLPLAQWAAENPAQAGPLQEEVEGEADCAQRFITEREVEAPAGFCAIQSFRAAMAVLRQQAAFAHELFLGGAVDEGERDELLEALDRRVRQLEITGPVWKPPRPTAVLRSLPFVRCLPAQQVERLLALGSFQEFKQGHEFWQATEAVARSDGAPGPGLFVVLGGVIRRRHVRPDGSAKEYHQGTGGIVGALLATTGTRLPGSEGAVAVGNTLGKGPLLFHLQQATMEQLMEEARMGKPAAQQLRLELLRMAGLYVTESTEEDMVVELHRHVALQQLLHSGTAPKQGMAAGAAVGGRMPAVPAKAAEPSGGTWQLAALMQLIAAQEVEEEEMLPATSAAASPAAGAAPAPNNGADYGRSGVGGPPAKGGRQHHRLPAAALVRAWAAQASVSVRQGLPTAVLLELPPRGTYPQTSHAVLLRGRLSSAARGATGPRQTRSASAAAAAAAGTAVQSRTVPAPAVLPWLWDPRLLCNAQGVHGPREEAWRAGSEGALLLVCLDGFGEVPAAVAEAQAASTAQQQPDAQQQGAGTEAEAAAAASSAGGGGSVSRGSFRRLMPWQHPMRSSKTAAEPHT